MKLICISCSNVQRKGNESASTTGCKLVAEIAQEKQAPTEIIRLIDYELSNCVFCGQCQKNGRCIRDEAFNQLYQKMTRSDAVVWMVPFYSVIPSKVTMVMEKVNQIYYTAWLKDPNAMFALSGKKAAVIAHGGSVLQDNPNAAKSYQDLLIKPLAYSLTSFGFDVVGLDDDIKGALFGVEGYHEQDDAIFPDMIHDWSTIKKVIAPLIHRLLQYSGK